MDLGLSKISIKNIRGDIIIYYCVITKFYYDKNNKLYYINYIINNKIRSIVISDNHFIIVTHVNLKDLDIEIIKRINEIGFYNYIDLDNSISRIDKQIKEESLNNKLSKTAINEQKQIIVETLPPITDEKSPTDYQNLLDFYREQAALVMRY